ncbi:MAG: ATP-binding protein [Bacteroidales bacterium]|nr:ATP-binding protein [Bacteroidales bacterium]MCF8328186.1 ATP-binding protein [Bacteroidales bacterium]
MSAYIKNRIKEGEHQQQDFKFEISDVKKIARSLSAFSNTQGGRLLVGVKDNGTIAGVRTDEEYYMIESAADLYCKPRVNFDYVVWNIEGKTVFEVTVPQTSGELVKAPDKTGRYKVYLRRNDENILANGIFVLADQLKKQTDEVVLQYSDNEKQLLHYLKTFGTTTFSQYRKQEKLDFFKTRDVFVKLMAWDVIQMDYDGKNFYYYLSENFDMLSDS